MMKTGFLSVILMLSIFLLSCRNEEGNKARGNAVITFAETNYEYGEIPFKGNGECEFAFRNTGKTPLVLTHVKSTCGCTIPEWPSEPVKAGEQGIIKVSYDTQRVGTFLKSIYVYSNAKNGVQRLYIRGRVNPHNEETENQ
jgi:hypothetical protein